MRLSHYSLQTLIYPIVIIMNLSHVIIIKVCGCINLSPRSIITEFYICINLWTVLLSILFALCILNIIYLVFSFAFLLPTRLASLPEKPVAIDWNFYRSAVAKAGMVDEFEKKVSFSQQVISQIEHVWNAVLKMLLVAFLMLCLEGLKIFHIIIIVFSFYERMSCNAPL